MAVLLALFGGAYDFLIARYYTFFDVGDINGFFKHCFYFLFLTSFIRGVGSNIIFIGQIITDAPIPNMSTFFDLFRFHTRLSY